MIIIIKKKKNTHELKISRGENKQTRKTKGKLKESIEMT